jgi:hypothetical protein
MSTLRTLIIACACASAGGAWAALTAEQAARLGKDLTPLGAEAAGNADGSIPRWDGGYTQVPPGFEPGKHYPDPFAADKPLLTITAANADEHKSRLTDGAYAMLKRYAGYKMPVYATRRSAAFPKCHYEETRQCAAVATLAGGGNGVTGCVGGVPFPVPKDGNEAIWNTLLRYRGDTFGMQWAQAALTRDGDFALVKFEYEYDFSYGNCSKPANQREPNKILNYLQTATAPARLAGQILLVHETVDQHKEPRSAWTYNPGQRRVRLAPNVAYDNPGTAAEGLRVNDDFGMFNGATDRYDWRLLGKREMYVPYNSYKLSDPALKYRDILKPGHLNQDLARYELHRVWIVEATLKAGTGHIYSKRVFYIDEDSWAIVATDKYDGRGQLWRHAEMHPMVFYNLPMLFTSVEVHYDILDGRYIASWLKNEEKLIYEPLKRTAGDYTPSNLRGVGTR